MGERIDPQAVERLYAERDYLDAYRAHTDLRVRENPQEAVGGMWEEIGALQFDYLVSHGLQPASRMLDIGCGTLRGGRHFIRYLDAGGYTGFDISAEAVAYARALVEAEGLAEKAPSLVLDADLTLGFEAFDRPFDVLLAQSVFTHLPLEGIETCLAGAPRVMHADSVFWFTFVDAPEPTRRTVKDFSWPFSLLGEAGARHGLTVTLMHDYPHPRGQAMARAVLA